MESAVAPAVVLVRPSEPGNIGAVARAMANTGLHELVIVEPAAPVDRTARAYAVHATEILDDAVRCASFSEATAPFQRLVGTTSSRDRAAKSKILTPRELAAALGASTQQKTALVFGPERSGLTTEELARCSPLVTIPASLRQPTFNLAQAVLVVAYEIFLVSRTPEMPEEAVEQASVHQVDGFLEHARQLLDEIGFSRDDTFDATFRDLRRLAARANLTSREVHILRGILRRTHHRLSGKPR
jgi:TrmH family RNA methyltransferase